MYLVINILYLLIYRPRGGFHNAEKLEPFCNTSITACWDHRHGHQVTTVLDVRDFRVHFFYGRMAQVRGKVACRLLYCHWTSIVSFVARATENRPQATPVKSLIRLRATVLRAGNATFYITTAQRAGQAAVENKLLCSLMSISGVWWSMCQICIGYTRVNRLHKIN